MTPEDHNGLKIIGLFVLIAALWVVAMSAVIWFAGKLDDGGGHPPSAWRK